MNGVNTFQSMILGQNTRGSNHTFRDINDKIIAPIFIKIIDYRTIISGRQTLLLTLSRKRSTRFSIGDSRYRKPFSFLCIFPDTSVDVQIPSALLASSFAT
jgi:hypothetical protein